MYSQRNEEEIILNYFRKEPIGNLLSIGENDGKTLSNSRALIEKGWGAILVEPCLVPFQKLSELYSNNKKVTCYNIAIGTENGRQEFYESGTHLNKGDTGLLSTLKKSELKRWEGTANKFITTEIDVWTFEKLYTALCRTSIYKFISIDAEGLDIDILKQINLVEVGCKCLCIEYNGIHKDYQEIKEYCMYYGGLKEIYQNYENLILAI